MVNYTSSNIKGYKGQGITVHEEFVPLLDRMNSFAAPLGITVWVTSSLRGSTHVPGAIVPPAKMSNHLVGHAVDCNLQVGSVWYNSEALKNPQGVVLDFILQCEAAHIRWGGRFKVVDSVHFDSGLNVLHPDKWHEIYNSLG